MKHLKRSLVLLLALATLLLAVLPTLVACNQTGETPGGETPGGETPGGTNPGTNPGTTPGTNVTYTVCVKSLGGILMQGVNVFVYADSTLSELKGYGTTDANGVASISLPAASGYHAVLSSGLPAGYEKAPSYAFSGNSLTVTLASSVIEDGRQPSAYKPGDIMHDFSFPLSDGTTLSLAKILEEKEAVLLNFWYRDCKNCGYEFPYLNAAYEQYKDKVEVIALNPLEDDLTFAEGVDLFSIAMPATNAPIARTLATAFGISGYPTSVVIDRYGAICLIEAGAIVEEGPFERVFAHFSAEDYEQKIYTSLGELIPAEKPSVQMPSSDEIGNIFDGNRFDFEYKPETKPSDAEYAWPFIIHGEKVLGVDCIRPSNSATLLNNTNLNNSFAVLYVTFHLNAGEAIAFDYYSSSEKNNDILYVIMEGDGIDRKDIYQISGESTEWKTCYPYVAPADGNYTLSLCYQKDGSTHVGDDTVYLSNLRILADKSEIAEPSYIPYYAATNEILGGGGYENYVSVFFNETDGYYHVGSVNGPLLLADLMGTTLFRKDNSVYYLAYEGNVTLNGVNYAEEIIDYCSYASNSELYGLCPVNRRLRELLEIVAAATGVLPTENTWLEMCEYYEAFGPEGTPQLPDPIRGLSLFSAFEAVESTPENPFPNVVDYNRVIMPRGLYTKFVPTRSGAYRITTNSRWEVDGWIFGENGEIIYTHEGGERLWHDEDDSGDLTMVYYMEAGKAYYIDVAFHDVYQYGTINFSLEFMGDTYDVFFIASQGYFVYEESTVEGEINEILTGGISVAYNETTGYYHELLADGSFGSILYLDVLGYSNIFGYDDFADLVRKNAFVFSMSENDQFILNWISQYGDRWEEELRAYWGEFYEENYAEYKVDEVRAGIHHGKKIYATTENDRLILSYVAKANQNGQGAIEYLRDLWGSDYDTNYALYQVEDVLNGVYHGVEITNATDIINGYIEAAYKVGECAETPELVGCVAVDRLLAEILQRLMDKYTFEGVENSFTKLCYYYRHYGPRG